MGCRFHKPIVPNEAGFSDVNVSPLNTFRTKEDFTDANSTEVTSTPIPLLSAPSVKNKVTNQEISTYQSIEEFSTASNTSTVDDTLEKRFRDGELECSDGCYLVYSSFDNGTFHAKYSRSYVPNALAVVTLTNPSSISPHKFKHPVLLLSKIHAGVPNYYQGWCLFVKEARSSGGHFSFLPELEKKQHEFPLLFPSMNIFLFSYTKVSCVPKGAHPSFVNLNYVEAVCCVPESYTGFLPLVKYTGETSLNQFVQHAREPLYSFYIVFQH